MSNVKSLQGEIAMVHLEAEELAQVIPQWAASGLPFDRWFGQQLKEVYGQGTDSAESGDAIQ